MLIKSPLLRKNAITFTADGKQYTYSVKLQKNSGDEFLYEVPDDFPEHLIKIYFGPDAEKYEPQKPASEPVQPEPEPEYEPDFVTYFKQHPAGQKTLKELCLDVVHAIECKNWKFFEQSIFNLADILDRANVWMELWKKQTIESAMPEKVR